MIKQLNRGSTAAADDPFQIQVNSFTLQSLPGLWNVFMMEGQDSAPKREPRNMSEFLVLVILSEVETFYRRPVGYALIKIRAKIDAIDQKLLQALNSRADLVHEIGLP